MAQSDYYKSQYNANKTKAKNLGKNEECLERIYNALVNNMSGKICDVNNELENIKTEMKKGVRHNGTYTSRANVVSNSHEKGTSADSELHVAISALDDELRDVRRKKATAISNRDSYQRQYKDKRKEERQEFLNNLF